MSLILVIFSFILLLITIWIFYPANIDHRFETKLLAGKGMKFTDCLNLLIEYKPHILLWHKAGILLFYSLLSTLFFDNEEKKKFPDNIVQKTKINKDPIFILGHFRSGTSMLHLLFSKDDELLTPNFFQCLAPRSFLSREKEAEKKYGHVRFKRPMDNMYISLLSPQEDEFAMMNLCQKSPLMALLFPKHVDHFHRYLTLKNIDEEELDIWKKTLLWFYKKILFQNPKKRLLLKSPVHTARLKLLIEMFPNAKFIHLSRHPYEIFQSTKKMHKALLSQWHLQKRDEPVDKWIEDTIINHFKIMYDEGYFPDLESLLQESNISSSICQIRFDELMNSPSKTMKKLYEELELPNWDKLEPKIKEFEEKVQKKYKLNNHPNLTLEEKKRIDKEWEVYFKGFGYEPFEFEN